MANISFSMTKEQYRDGTKDVTRRYNSWQNAKVGDRLQAVEKSQGLKKGETVKTMGWLVLVDVRLERLDEMIKMPAYGIIECRREGFPDMRPEEFVQFFCNGHRGCQPGSVVTRIEFMREPSHG